MKYLSEKTNKVYDSVEELEHAEKAHEAVQKEKQQQREERTQRAKEIEDAYKNYLELKAKFIEDYGSYHMTLTEKDLPSVSIGSLLDLLFDRFFVF